MPGQLGAQKLQQLTSPQLSGILCVDMPTETPLFARWIKARTYQTAAVRLFSGRSVATASPAQRGDDDRNP